MKKLIINADDFGKFARIDDGIIEGINAGVITSTSVLVFGKYAGDARKLIDYKNVSIGLHFDKRFDNDQEMVSDFDKQLNMFIAIVGRHPDHIDFHKLNGLEEYPLLYKSIVENPKLKSTPIRRMGFANYIGDFFAMDTRDYKTIDLDKVSVSSLIKVLDTSMVEGANELVCHAGRVDDEVRESSSYWSARELELETLLSKEFKKYIKDNDIQLISWKEI